LDRKALPEPESAAGEYRGPQTVWETEICAAFAEVLGIERIGLDDNFFEHGGNSLVATKLAARLSAALAVQVPVMSLFTAPTPAELIAELEARAAGRFDAGAAFDVVLPLRPSGAAEPLFCVHPIGGIAWSFAGLAAHLGQDRPIYGLQSPVLGSDEALPESIEDWARRYVKEIRVIQPEGPYHLLGWSLGGVIAHAMAVQLQNEGEQVALLAMMDSHLIAMDGEIETLPLAELLGGLLGGHAGELGLDADVDVARLAERLARLPEPFASFGADRIARVLDAGIRSAALIGAYRARPFVGDLVYFTAAHDDPTGSAGVATWADAVVGTVHNHPVEASHWRLTTDPALARIGKVLSETWHRRSI
jgi:thioesterase domain-containing protein